MQWAGRFLRTLRKPYGASDKELVTVYGAHYCCQADFPVLIHHIESAVWSFCRAYKTVTGHHLQNLGNKILRRIYTRGNLSYAQTFTSLGVLCNEDQCTQRIFTGFRKHPKILYTKRNNYLLIKDKKVFYVGMIYFSSEFCSV